MGSHARAKKFMGKMFLVGTVTVVLNFLLTYAMFVFRSPLHLLDGPPMIVIWVEFVAVSLAVVGGASYLYLEYTEGT